MGDHKTIEEVIRTERRWVQAHRDLDVKAIESILSADYAQIQTDGSVKGKEDVINSYRSGLRTWVVAESDQYDVRLYGDVAIMIGRWRGKGQSEGSKFDYSARFLAVYLKCGSNWELVADQSTPIR
jgi:ketosteroid isomerase-like protein